MHVHTTTHMHVQTLVIFRVQHSRGWTMDYFFDVKENIVFDRTSDLYRTGTCGGGGAWDKGHERHVFVVVVEGMISMIMVMMMISNNNNNSKVFVLHMCVHNMDMFGVYIAFHHAPPQNNQQPHRHMVYWPIL